MSQNGGLDALKDASGRFVKTLFQAYEPTGQLHVGIVPFSQGVNVGPIPYRGHLWTDAYAVIRDGYPQYWTGCVEERRKTLGLTDTPPDVSRTDTLFRAYYSPDTASAVPPGHQLNDWIRTNLLGVKSYRIVYDGPAMSQQQGPGAFCPQPMTSPTDARKDVLAGLDAMTAQGVSLPNIGMVWAWRMLSPRWKDRWAAEGLPRNYDAPGAKKAVVLFTDGGSSVVDKVYTAYGYLSEGRMGATDRLNAEAELDARFLTVCDAMKAKGIRIFTIAYDRPAKADRQLLKACASEKADAFEAAGPADLGGAFDKVRKALKRG